MSELGILPVKSRSSETTEITILSNVDVSWKISPESVLQIKSKYSMLTYLNSESPFNSEGWLDTGDVVEVGSSFRAKKFELGNATVIAKFPKESTP